MRTNEISVMTGPGVKEKILVFRIIINKPPERGIVFLSQIMLDAL